ncbi:hypothetical protein [Methanohalobium sp.]|uniref:hypothetical protein n=1 Tax=Methanohalobium sp. TaxID=2837493 RepID=UPI0025D30102|nr:hypothetical protein [Methanohalobium sp.]
MNKNQSDTLDARYNYWNSSQGPDGTNGAEASSNVSYEPYTEECANITIENTPMVLMPTNQKVLLYRLVQMSHGPITSPTMVMLNSTTSH